MTHADQGVKHGVVKAKVVEPDHPCVIVLEVTQERNDVFGVVAPVADLKHPAQRGVRVFYGQREHVRKCLTVKNVIVTHRVCPTEQPSRQQSLGMYDCVLSSDQETEPCDVPVPLDH